MGMAESRYGDADDLIKSGFILGEADDEIVLADKRKTQKFGKAKKRENRKKKHTQQNKQDITNDEDEDEDQDNEEEQPEMKLIEENDDEDGEDEDADLLKLSKPSASSSGFASAFGDEDEDNEDGDEEEQPKPKQTTSTSKPQKPSSTPITSSASQKQAPSTSSTSSKRSSSSNDESDKNLLRIGLIGHPNAGKSSAINALTGKYSVGVSARPGYTKHIQTLPLLIPTINSLYHNDKSAPKQDISSSTVSSSSTTSTTSSTKSKSKPSDDDEETQIPSGTDMSCILCDCPGLVFPAADMPKVRRFVHFFFLLRRLTLSISGFTSFGWYLPL
jgi:hypothetical protein